MYLEHKVSAEHVCPQLNYEDKLNETKQLIKKHKLEKLPGSLTPSVDFRLKGESIIWVHLHLQWK